MLLLGMGLIGLSRLVCVTKFPRHRLHGLQPFGSSRCLLSRSADTKEVIKSFVLIAATRRPSNLVTLPEAIRVNLCPVSIVILRDPSDLRPIRLASHLRPKVLLDLSKLQRCMFCNACAHCSRHHLPMVENVQRNAYFAKTPRTEPLGPSRLNFKSTTQFI